MKRKALRALPMGYDPSLLSKEGLNRKRFDEILLRYAAAGRRGAIQIHHKNAMIVCTCQHIKGSCKNGIYKIYMQLSFISHARDMTFEEKVNVRLVDYSYGLMLRAKTVKSMKKDKAYEYTITLEGKMDAN